MQLENKVQDFPRKPGVYIIRSKGEAIYVGKSSSLRDRVKNYFNPSPTSPKIRALQDQMDDLEYIVTDSEVEALILEENLIKEHKPRYNIELKDNKRYPYAKITDDKFPRIELTRRRSSNSAEYFGPYTNVNALRKTLETIEKFFAIRSCNWSHEQGTRRPCLRYHLERCPAPCAGEISSDEYDQAVKTVKELLNGNEAKLAGNLREKMNKAAQNQNYERAAELRDKLKAITAISDNQHVRISDSRDQDYIASYHNESTGTIQIFFVRDGRIKGGDSFEISVPVQASEKEILNSFIKEFYQSKQVIPSIIYTLQEPADRTTLGRWLSDIREEPVELSVPQRGKKKQIIQMARKNAEFTLEEVEGDLLTPPTEGVMELRETLNLDFTPRRIEGFDISNTSGTDAVGSMVVFVNGQPAKNEYRRFKINGPNEPDDYRMIQEVLERRFSHGQKEQQDHSDTDKFSTFPDLILVDGGKGQLSAAKKAVVNQELDTTIRILGIAKEYDTIFRAAPLQPVSFNDDSSAVRILQRIRDEAHRFAVNYHRRLRQKRTIRSSLDTIEGVGPKRKKQLLNAFGSVKGVRMASKEEIRQLPNFSDQLAQRVYSFFHSQD